MTPQKQCLCKNCHGIDFSDYCKNCEHGISFMEIHKRGPSWDGICSSCHLAEYKALQDRKPIKDLEGEINGILFEYHNGCTIILGRSS